MKKHFWKNVFKNSLQLYSLEEYYLEKIYNETSYFLLGYANLTNEEIEGGILLLLKNFKRILYIKLIRKYFSVIL